MQRREFLKNCGLLGASCVTLPLFFGSCKPVFYASCSMQGNRIVVKKSDFLSRTYVLVKNERIQAPIYLCKINENEYSAVLMVCTHKGCELNPAGNNLVCPCHGAEFSNTGKVLMLPAERDLQKYTTATDNENIYINL